MKKWLAFLLLVLWCAAAAAPKPKDREEPTSTAAVEEPERRGEPLNFELSFISDLLANVSGGVAQGTELMGSLLLDFGFDAEAAAGWNGASFHASLLGIYGGPLSPLVGDFQTVSNIEAPPTVRLFSAYYQQSFWQDKLSVLVGLYNVDSEFDIRDSAELFVHSSPGTGGEIGQLGQNGPGIFPVGALGGRLRYENAGWYAQTAVIEGAPGDPDDPFGNTFTLDAQEGLFVIGEVGHVFSDEVGQLGKVGLGAWGFTTGFETHLDPEARAGNRGAYLSLEKTLYREEVEPEQGLSVYLRTGVADGRVNPIETFVGAGLVYTGLFSGRGQDQVGLGLNTGFASVDFLRSGDFDRHETALELTYSFAVNDHLSIQPELQYILNPGFESGLENAWVVGLRAVSTFSTGP